VFSRSVFLVLSVYCSWSVCAPVLILSLCWWLLFVFLSFVCPGVLSLRFRRSPVLVFRPVLCLSLFCFLHLSLVGAWACPCVLSLPTLTAVLPVLFFLFLSCTCACSWVSVSCVCLSSFFLFDLLYCLALCLPSWYCWPALLSLRSLVCVRRSCIWV